MEHLPLTEHYDPHLAAFHLAVIAADAGLPAERAAWVVLNRSLADFDGFPDAELYAARLGAGRWRAVSSAQAGAYLRRNYLVCACGLA
jgi:hypothetical protein